MSSRKKSSAFESRFASLWDALGGVELVREFRFDKPRRWRADFASESARVLLHETLYSIKSCNSCRS